MSKFLIRAELGAGVSLHPSLTYLGLTRLDVPLDICWSLLFCAKILQYIYDNASVDGITPIRYVFDKPKVQCEPLFVEMGMKLWRRRGHITSDSSGSGVTPA